MKRSAAAAVCLAIVVLLALVAVLPSMSAVSLKQLTPTSKTVPGWETVGDQLYSESPEKLFLIYDGGDVEYIESGVQEAVQQTYKKEKALVIVALHRMSDWQKAKAFYADKRDRTQKARKLDRFADLKVDKAGFLAVQYGQCHGWSWNKQYVMSFTTRGATDADQTALKTFMAAVAKTIQKSG